MASRLAMVATNDFEGPWTRTDGSETGVRVRGLNPDDELFLEISNGNGTAPIRVKLSVGDNEWVRQEVTKYRMVKRTCSVSKPVATYAEVLLDV